MILCACRMIPRALGGGKPGRGEPNASTSSVCGSTPAVPLPSAHHWQPVRGARKSSSRWDPLSLTVARLDPRRIALPGRDGLAT